MDKKVKIDLKDKKILRELDMDARIPMNKLAKEVGLSRQVVQYRIDRMKEEGVILGALTIFDSVVAGKRWFRIAVQLQKINKEKKNEFIEYVKKHPNICWFGEVGGNWDFVMNFITKDQFTFDRLIEDILEKWGEFVRRYEVLVYINVRDQKRGYILQEEGMKRKTMSHEMKYNPKVKLDELDKKIISIISRNAWLSNSQVAMKLKVNYKTIQNRIKEMEKNRLILGYRAMIHPKALGYESYMIFLGIHSYKKEIEKKLDLFLKHPNVTFVVRQLGKWRIGIEIEVKNREEFQKFLIELRTRFGEVISEYETFPIFYDYAIDYFPLGALK